MTYTKGPVIALPQSASLSPSNLCLIRDAESGSGHVSYAVIHRDSVHLVHSSGAAGESTTQERVRFEEKEEADTMAAITQVRWCRLKSSRLVLVLASLRGCKICEWNGSNAFYTSSFVTPPGSYESRFTKGIVSTGNAVCVGTSEGAILVLCVPTKGCDVIFTRQLQGHSAPVCDLAANGEGLMASADETGTILLWGDPVVNAESIRRIETGGVPCICLCFWKLFLIGGFSNGLIKIFNSESGSKSVEIAAHSHSITAMDIAHKSGLLLSVSEDATAAVWSLPTVSNPKVSLVYTTLLENSVLCGGRFCDEEGSTFALTAYDEAEIYTFSRP